MLKKWLFCREYTLLEPGWTLTPGRLKAQQRSPSAPAPQTNAIWGKIRVALGDIPSEQSSPARDKLILEKRTREIIKIILAGILLLGFFAVGVYLFAFKPDATDAQKTYATIVLTSIVSGGVGYAFGKQEKNTPDAR